MKHVLLIATGGTIASKPEEGFLTPKISPEELLEYVPELKSICKVSAIQPFFKDSTNMTYQDWLEVSKIIKENYDNYDGFVITHGTDTMAYCSAALSYLIQNNKKPVVITGSQQSIYLRDTDARANLLNAFIYASSDDACLTHVVFDGKVISGTRAKKTRTKSFNAFSSIDYPEVAWIIGGKVKYFIKEKASDPVFYDKINTSVIAIKLIPGMSAEVLELLAGKYSAVVIESFGVGGIPSDENAAFEKALKKLKKGGTKIIMTTQVTHEGSDMGVYKVGSIKHTLGLIEARDMTVEAIIGKTVWALAESKTDKEFEKLFKKPVGMDRF
ncbi:MAG: asparaginase [Clostridia bacterium]|nr:asparaginase [Clostridia bacterium]